MVRLAYARHRQRKNQAKETAGPATHPITMRTMVVIAIAVFRTQTANAPISASTTVKRGRPATMPVNAKQPGNVIPPTTMRTMAVIAVVVFPTLTATSQDNDFTAVLAVSRATMRGYASRESLWGTRRHSLRGRAVVANSQTYESSRGSCSSRAHRPICLRYTAILAGFLLPENQGQGRG